MVTTLKEVQALLDQRTQLGPWSSHVMAHATAEHMSSDGTLLIRLPVTEDICNASMNLHGGAIATAIDVFTTLALYLRSQSLSVTIDLHTTCASGAPVGSDVLFECKVDRLGRSVQFSSCVRRQPFIRLPSMGTSVV